MYLIIVCIKFKILLPFLPEDKSEVGLQFLNIIYDQILRLILKSSASAINYIPRVPSGPLDIVKMEDVSSAMSIQWQGLA